MTAHPEGYWTYPDFPHVACCPKCYDTFHPGYWPKHSPEECEQTRLWQVRKVMQS